MFDQASIQAFIAQLKPAVDAVANTLQTTAENLWTIGIAKQYVDGIYSAALALTGLILFLISFKVIPKIWTMFKQWNESMDRWDRPIGLAFGVVVIAIYFVSASILLFDNLYPAILHLVDPQYTLIMEIKDAVQPSHSEPSS